MNKTIHLLIVEDNPGDAELARETLSASGRPYDIQVVGDGAEAIDYLRQREPWAGVRRPDLVLLDLNLPRIDGRQVLAEMKGDRGLHAIPVVVLSSSDAERDVASSYELGANCYVTKPVGLDAYQHVVRSVEDYWFGVAKLP
jgi:CheY-like chemotaxis protein